MIVDTVAGLGAWSWIIFGLVLLVGEILLPGVFLIWFGSAAIAVGLLTLAFPPAGWWAWQVQIVAFGLLSLVFAFVGIRLFPNTSPGDAASRMNAPLDRFVGRRTTLVEPIVGGAGRVKLGDTTWRVIGPDLPAGTEVEVVGNREGALVVHPVTA